MKRTNIKQFIGQVWPAPPVQADEEGADSIWKRIRAKLKDRRPSPRSSAGPWADAQAVNQREFQVLSAAALLGGEGDIVRITHVIEYWAGRFMIARVHAALWRLEKRGLIRFHRNSPDEDGRQPRTHFAVTEDGDRAIHRAEAEGMPLTNC